MAYIINQYGVLHSYPDGRPLPVGARPATEKEVADWQKQDAQSKAANRAEKRRRAEDRAQLVIINGGKPDDQSGDEVEEPKGKKDAN